MNSGPEEPIDAGEYAALMRDICGAENAPSSARASISRSRLKAAKFYGRRFKHKGKYRKVRSDT